MKRTPLVRSRQTTSAIDHARFTEAVREGLTIRALAERFALSVTKASMLRHRVLVAHGQKDEETR